MTIVNVVSIDSVPEMESIELPLPSSNAPPSPHLAQWDALLSRSPAYQLASPLDHIEADRTKLCEWAYLLVDHYDIERSIVGVAFSMFDRYVAANGAIRLELLALSCVYIAIKVHSCSGKFPVGTLVKLARSSGVERFDVEEMEEMELCIYHTLGWHVNPPTYSVFLDVAFDFIDDSVTGWDVARIDAMKDLATFLVEISVCDVYFATSSPSSVAAAALLVAMEELSAPKTVRKLLKSLQLDRQETKMCAQRLSQHYQNWKSNEEMKRPNRSQSASPTGVDLLESASRVIPEGEGNSLQEAFEEVSPGNVVEHPNKRGGGSKRKRDVSC